MIQKQTTKAAGLTPQKRINMALITVTATTSNPERAEFITVTGPKGTEHTYFYAEADESTVTEILQQLGLNPAQPLCQMVEEVLRAAMNAQRNEESSTFEATFELGEDLDAQWRLVPVAA
jgi:hypothetical protein